jgi:heme-degrading monooxygenase HmoA
MYVAMRAYRANPGSADEIKRRVHEGFVPLVSQIHGFSAHHLMDAPNDTVVSVSLFEDQAGADESSRIVADWAEQHLSGLLQAPPAGTSGPEITGDMP